MIRYRQTAEGLGSDADDAGRGRCRRGFTLVELLVVIVIIGILMALLIPVIAGAVRTANDARVSGEIQIFSQALAQFKNNYGDYPPSRIILNESGFYDVNDPTLVGQGDVTVGQLATRSLTYLRKFFPKVRFSTTQPLFYGDPAVGWHDFNGNAQFDGPYILEGHECLAFFLGGIPSFSGSGMSGFAKNPINPFVGDATNTNLGTTSRTPPLFEFRAERLADNDGDGIPGYNDPYASGATSGEGNSHFYVYFSSYGQNAYDPNDANNTAFEPLPKAFVTNRGVVYSPGPNPYTSSVALPILNPNLPIPFTKFVNPNGYQILSSGGDGYYGIGGRFAGDTANEKLPISKLPPPNTDVEEDYFNATPLVREEMIEARRREKDNLTNFTRGRLD